MSVVIDGTTGIDTIEPTIVPTALNATGSAPLYAARAWVNFNGTGTVAIRASGNVSSITDNGTGDYTTNFTTAMPDANYVANYSMDNFIVSGDQLIWVQNLTSTSVDVRIFNNGYKDPVTNMIAIFR